jgi:hypothetical protein
MSRPVQSVASKVWETLFYTVHLDKSLISNFLDIHMWDDFGTHLVNCNEIRIFLGFWEVNDFYY